MMHALAWTDGWLYSKLFCDVCEERRTYLELGALDGLKASNTKLLESQLNWSGVLIEGEPGNAQRLRQHRGRSGRNAIFAEAVCNATGTVRYGGKPGHGAAGLLDAMSGSRVSQNKRSREVPCQRLSSMLAAASVQKQVDAIDFFSLDVEGAELLVLQTMDWSIPVRALLVETGNDAVRRFLASHGYVLFNPFPRPLTGADLARGKAKVPIEYARMSGNELFLHRELMADLPGRIAECSRCERLPKMTHVHMHHSNTD